MVVLMYQKTHPFELLEEAIQLLNAIDAGYVGLTKPSIEHIDETQQDYLPGDSGY
jgi:hypothetical protein